jgi:hypothetical protein
VRAADVPARVEWCHLGARRFTEPFFEQTIGAALGRPFNQLFARETTIDTLVEAQRVRPGLPPTAFIFHCSRCGSTLYSQLAAALPDTIVLSEAPPIDHVLRAAVPGAVRIEWLRAVVGALAQPRSGVERHLFVKFDAWHVAEIRLVQRAFPGVPCLYLYRDPAAVLASQLRMPGIHMIPGVLDASITGIDPSELLTMRREDQCARILEWAFATGLAHAEAGRVALVNYSELPGAAIRQVLEWCESTDRDDRRRTLEQTALADAKTPVLPFAPGLQQIPDAAKRAVETRLTKMYERLESHRRPHL